MALKQSVRTTLRAATADHHERLDAVFSGFDLGDRADYERFLTAQAAALVAVEEALTRAGAASVIPDWEERTRADLLRADLAALELPFPAASPGVAFGDFAAILGGAYVLEGSRLGAGVLRPRVAPGLPSGFLQPADSGSWRRFITILEERLTDEPAVERAAQAAIAVFGVFEASGRSVLAVPSSGA